MAKIAPIRAVTYNQDVVKDLSKVTCPPYDVISPAKQQYYHDLSAHNFIHILLGKDVPGQDKYQRAANLYKDWLKSKVFVRDNSPAIYFYSHTYSVKGEKKTRLGFIALLSLEDKKSAIFAHEHTRLEPKEDRLRLLKAVKANLSPIFVLFPDAKRIIQRAYQQYIVINKKPFIDLVDDEKSTHKLWKIDDQGFLEKFKKDMQEANIYIADGHHRYEVACTYKELMQQKASSPDKDGGFNYILAYFTNVESGGLTILPIHRLVKLPDSFQMQDFITSLNDYFEIKEFKDKSRFLFLMQKAGAVEHVLGMYKDKKYWLLRLKNARILDKMISDKPREYRLLDVSVLNYIVLDKILRLGLDNKESVSFVPDADEMIARVDENPAYMAFLLNPVKIRQMMSVAMTGERMPPKSTYFYPKVLSGLVINPLE